MLADRKGRAMMPAFYLARILDEVRTTGLVELGPRGVGGTNSKSRTMVQTGRTPEHDKDNPGSLAEVG